MKQNKKRVNSISTIKRHSSAARIFSQWTRPVWGSSPPKVVNRVESSALAVAQSLLVASGRHCKRWANFFGSQPIRIFLIGQSLFWASDSSVRVTCLDVGCFDFTLPPPLPRRMTELSRLGQFADGADLIGETFGPCNAMQIRWSQSVRGGCRCSAREQWAIYWFSLVECTAERRTVAKVKTLNWITTSNLVGMVLVDALIDFGPRPYPFCSLLWANKKNFMMQCRRA